MAYVNTVSTLTSPTFRLHPQIKLKYTNDIAAVNQLHVNVCGWIMVHPNSRNGFVLSLLYPWKEIFIPHHLTTFSSFLLIQIDKTLTLL